MNSFTMTLDTLTVLYQGATYTLRKGADNFDKARILALEERWEELAPLLSPALAIKAWLAGSAFAVKDNLITYQGETIDQSLNERLLKMMQAGANPSSWLRFWERLQRNPSYRSVHQLHAFLARENIPVDEEGFILAYKSVTHDYLDFHTKTISNTPGVTVSMPRNKISDDPNLGCHEGLHVGALPYALSFGSNKRIIVCRIDPEHVVCVPYDCSYQKMRVCQYEVLGNYSGAPLPSDVWVENAPVDASAEEEDLEEEDLEEEEEDLEEVNAIHVDLVVGDLASDLDLETESWGGNSALHFLLRMGLRQSDVAKATGLDDGNLSRASKDRVVLKPQSVARILAAFPDVFDYSKMDERALLASPLAGLRAYARNTLKIVGAERLPTQEALVQRVLEVRTPRGVR